MIKDIDSLTQPIIDIYSQIELDLIIEIAKRFEMNDEIGGTLEWQLKKLDELGALNSDTLKVISKYSKKSEAEILKMIEKAELANINLDDLTKAYSQKQIAVDPLRIKDNTSFTELAELTYRELKDTYRLIQTKALESAKQAYMDIVNRSYVEVATGTYDYGTSIRRAVKQMAQNGINGATYIRNGKIVQYSIESTVRRDTLTAVHKLANKASEKVCDELGAEYVEISSHLGARVHPTNPIANHAGWQGKIFKVIGSDGKYPNLKESTGYPDDIQGLGGVNCRHRMFPFFPGISVPNPIKYDEEENRRVYELSQKQRAMERKMRRLKKQQAAAKAMGDSETAKKLNKDIVAQSDAIQAFCDENGLRRDHGRELVSEQLIKKKDIANSGNSGIINTNIEETTDNDVHYIGKINKEIYSCVANDIVTDEVIITDERIEHIQTNHPNDFEQYFKRLIQAITEPEYIIEANKPNTALVLKSFRSDDKVFKTILRLITLSDNPDFKNSVITFMKIDEKEWKRLIKNKKILYKSE